tara:strand:+ start:192 stop:374 length:183 start_codon:yes stop_codon:yes gene_type:complete
MKVKELIKILEGCDSELPVFAFLYDSIYPIDIVDNTISDRVDINIKKMRYVLNDKKENIN